MSQEQADQAIREATGQDPKDILSDKRTESERQYDKDFPAAQPHEIQWPYSPEEGSTPQYEAFVKQVNGYLTGIGFTKSVSEFILKEADAFGYRSEKWTPEEHVLFGRSETTKLQCLWGDKTAERINLAKSMVQQLERKQPGIVALLERTGLGNHSGIILQLANHAERLAYRNGNKK